MLRRPARELESSREIALLIAGDESPEWLAKLIDDILDGIKFRRLLDRIEPTRAELRSRFEKLREAKDLIFRALYSPQVRDFLGSPAPGVISHEDFARALVDFGKRIDRADKDKALIDAVGQAKRGRGRARAAMRPPTEVAVALLIAEMWRYFRHVSVAPGSKKAANAAEKYWGLAGGGAHDAGDEPLACWKPRFVEVLRGSSDPQREEALEKLRREIRHLLEGRAQGRTLIDEIDEALRNEKMPSISPI